MSGRLHAARSVHVILYVTLRLNRGIAAFAAAAVLQMLPATADETGISRILKGVEKRYNGSKTLEAGFSEAYTFQGRKRTESGTLYLRKPGRMRWDYRIPAGKLFISDGKEAFFYDPESNRAEKVKLKETEDLRAPMAFLLGRLDFSKDFQQFQSRPDGANVWITASPKSDNVPYRQVQFLVTPDFRIDKLTVTGQDSSIMEFTFSGEKKNPALNDALFRFQLPPGAQYVDSAQTPGGGSR